jgi:lipopolysaccharide/colanic/teichoic acid biosynthesis glycosyltransferase
MKIIVSGARGFVGRNIIPHLIEAGANVTLLSRDPASLRSLFPHCEAMSYDRFEEKKPTADLLVHLAVANNNSQLSSFEIDEVNVGWMLHLAETAHQAGIKHFLNTSSTHALDEKNETPYAQSKREGAKRLRERPELNSSTLYLANVYSDEFSGNLAILNKLPTIIARGLFTFLSALKPTVHAKRVAQFCLLTAKGQGKDDHILADNQEYNIIYRILRRSLDLAFALFVLLFLNWALLLIWIIIRLESPGPGLFKQERVGKNLKPFTLYKFRSMATGTKTAPTHETSQSSVTRFGQFLRKTKLDELPQAWNLIRNDISLVGPRPCLPIQAELIACRSERNVFAIKPGITGLAQINNIDMSDPERLAEWDARYMALRGLIFDIKIMIRTALGKGIGDHTRGEKTIQQ